LCECFCNMDGRFFHASYYKFLDTNSQRVNLKNGPSRGDTLTPGCWMNGPRRRPLRLASNDEQVHAIILYLWMHMLTISEEKGAWSVMALLFRVRWSQPLLVHAAGRLCGCTLFADAHWDWQQKHLFLLASLPKPSPLADIIMYVTKGCWRGVSVYLSFFATLSRCSIICQVKIMLRRSGI